MLLQDIRYALRIHAKTAGLTVVSLLTLALGIGSSAAVFSVVNAVLLKPLPYPGSERVLISWRVAPTFYGNDDFPWNPRDFKLLTRADSKVFESMGAFKSDSFNLTGVGKPELVEGVRASAGFFQGLGVAPLLGRTYTSEEDQPGHEHEVVLSHQLWSDRFGADKGIVGRAVELNGFAYTVIGVMPGGFAFPHANEMPASLPFPKEAQLWVPLALSAAPRGPDELGVIARLKPGIAIDQAQSEMDVFEKRLEAQTAQERGWLCRLRTLSRQIVGDNRRPLLMVFGAGAVVLLIACFNVASILLMRALERAREFSLRSALGAGQGRLVRQLLTESILLAAVGGVLGTIVAQAGIYVVKALGPATIPRLQETNLDIRVLVFVSSVTLFAGVLFGLAPILGATRKNLAEPLKEGNRRAGGSPVAATVRNAFLVSQVALSLVLATAGVLLVRTFYHMLSADPGFNPSSVISFELPLPLSKYPDPDQMARVYQRVLQELQSVSGVKAAGLVSAVPMGGAPDGSTIRIPDHPTPSGQSGPFANYSFASPNYFSALGTPLLQGRDFQDSDNAQSVPITIINAAMAKKFWPGESAIGKQVGVANLRFPARVIVGIVANIKHGSLSEDPAPEMYVPYTQNEIKIWPSMQAMQFAVRTGANPSLMEGSIAKAVHSVDADLPVAKVATLTTLVENSMSQARFSMILLGAFGVLSVVLSSIGIYGAISYWVVQRTPEIGVRMALGATRKTVFGMVLSHGARLAALGIAAGLITALLVSRAMVHFLYGVRPTDPLTFTVVPLLLLLMILIACYLPAYRATQVDPMIALRSE